MPAHWELFPQWRLIRRQRWYFRLVSANNEVIHTSEAYSSKGNAERGIADLQRVAAEAVDVRLVDSPK